MAISAAERQDLKAELKKELREEMSPTATRRNVMKGLVAGAVGGSLVGGVGEAAGAAGYGEGTLDISYITPNTYRVAGNWYAGLAADRAELTATLGAGDAGARYTADDTGDVYRFDGSSWSILNASTTSVGLTVGSGVQYSYSSIQDALNSLTATDRIFITPDYDYTVESLPIDVQIPCVIEGPGWNYDAGYLLDFGSDSSNSVFAIDLDPDGNQQTPRRTVTFRELLIEGGDTAFEVGNGGHYRWQKVKCQNQSSYGVKYALEDGGLYARADQLWVQSAGVTGFDQQATDATGVTFSPSAHDSFFTGCSFNGCGTGIRFATLGNTFIGGSVESNAGVGMSVTGRGNPDAGTDPGLDTVKAAPVVYGTYFEGNGADNPGGSDDSDVLIQYQGGLTPTFRDTFHSGSGPADHAYYVQNGTSVYISNPHGPGFGASQDVYLAYVTDAVVETVQPNVTVTLSGNQTRARVNGLVVDEGPGDTPSAGDYRPGDNVEWTDTTDGSGDGVYVVTTAGTVSGPI